MKKTYLRSTATLTGLAIVLFGFNSQAQSTQTLTYAFTGATQTFVVPSCVSTITMEAKGAQGASQSPGGTGGLGAYVKGVINVTPGQVISIYVGGQNGYNGGGIGGVNGNSISNGPSTGNAGNGGGASDIRIGGITLNDRVIVAGGGGGGAHDGVWTGCPNAGPAGNGGTGGLNGGIGGGGSSTACNCTGGGGNGGVGGTATLPGTAGTYNSGGCLQGWALGSPGALGIGGAGSTVYYNGTGGGGGGGGGYYGGGSGGSGSDTTPGGGGGGGSSFVGSATNTIVTSGTQSGDGQVVFTFAGSGSAVSASASSPSICLGSSAVLTASNALTYTWSAGPTTGSNVSVSPTVTTSYTVLAVSVSGCTSTAVVSVTVDQSAPTLTVAATPSALCIGDIATLTASGATTYSWSNNAATASTTVNPVASTVYSVTGSNGGICAATQSIALAVNALPNVGATSSKSVICRSETAVLTATGATTYSWSNGGTTASIAVTLTTNTTYTVNGTVNGCSKTTVITQSVNACLGIAALSSSDELLSIYPNPNNGDFTIQAKTPVNVTVMNETGQLVKQLSLTEKNAQVNISHLANGIYLVMIEKDGAITTKKVVVSK